MTSIAALYGYAPETVVTTEALAQRIPEGAGLPLDGAALGKLIGVAERRWAVSESSIQLALRAASAVLPSPDVDVVIAAASNVIASKNAPAQVIAQLLGASAARAVDVSSGCRAFLDGLRLAQAFVAAKKARRVLVVSGAKQSPAVEEMLAAPADHPRAGLTSLTYGDAAAAALVEEVAQPTLRIRALRATPPSEHTTSEPGAEDAYGARALRRACTHLPRLIGETLAEAGWTPDGVECVVGPQISTEITRWVAERAQIPVERCVHSLEHFGNTGAAAIPFTLKQTLDAQPGVRKALLVAAAAGVGGVVIALER